MLGVSPQRKKSCVVVGAGGHARVILDCLISAGDYEVCCLLDLDSSRWGQTLQGVTIRGGDELLSILAREGVVFFALGVGSVGDNRPRQRLFELALRSGLQPAVVKHSSAVCSPWARMGGGCQLLPGSIVNAGAELGSNVILNSGAIVEHDCWVGDHTHVATGARLCGTVRLGSSVHVGAGATVKQGIMVGDGAVIGAGAVVVRDVASGTTVVGVPAEPRVARDLASGKGT